MAPLQRVDNGILDVRIRGPPNDDIVQGYPGIAATKPRLEGVVEIRTKEPTIPITAVSVALYRTDTIRQPNNKGPSQIAPKKEQSYLVTPKIPLFRCSAGSSYDEVVALDLPFIMMLPTNGNLPASICIGKATVETVYKLFVTVTWGKQHVQHHIGYPVRIRCYDTLSTYGAFRVPVCEVVQSADHLVQLDYSLPVTSFGPHDIISVYLRICGNPDWTQRSRRIKLQRLTMQIVEVITFNHEGDEPTERRRRILKVFKEVDEKLPDNGYNCELSMEVPTEQQVANNGVIAKERQDVSHTACNGFTTSAALYKVEYLLVLKARFSHAKDIEVEQPITMSQFDHATCVSFMKSIHDEATAASKVRQLVAPRPKVYHPDSQSMWLLGRLTSGSILVQ